MLRAKLAELKALQRSIAGFVANCDASCAGGPGPDYVIPDDLSNPGLCERLADILRITSPASMWVKWFRPSLTRNRRCCGHFDTI
jgi:hypothetical protein